MNEMDKAIRNLKELLGTGHDVSSEAWDVVQAYERQQFVKVFDTMQISVGLIDEIAAQPRSSSVMVTVAGIEMNNDGSKRLILRSR